MFHGHTLMKNTFLARKHLFDGHLGFSLEFSDQLRILIALLDQYGKDIGSYIVLFIKRAQIFEVFFYFYFSMFLFSLYLLLLLISHIGINLYKRCFVYIILLELINTLSQDIYAAYLDDF